MGIGVTHADLPSLHRDMAASLLSWLFQGSPSIEPEVPKTTTDFSLKTQTTKALEHPTQKGNYNKAQ